MNLQRFAARLPLSNRLRWRVVIGLTAVSAVAIAGVALLSYVLAASSEHEIARQTALTETAVLREVVDETAPTERSLSDVLAAAGGVEAAIIEPDGTLGAATGALSASDLERGLPPAGQTRAETIDGRRVLLTATPLSDGSQLLLVFDQHETRQSLAALRSAVVAAVVLMAAVLLIVMATATRRILDPVDRTARAARRLAQGALGTRLGDDTPHLFADLTGAFDEMAAALEETIRHLQEMEQRQRVFVADVSHELRTPLQALSTASDLLEPAVPTLNGSARRAGEALIDETRRLRSLVDDLMEISRLDADNPEPDISPVALTDMLRSISHRNGWTPPPTIDAPHGLQIHTDPRRLDIIVTNLLRNAYTHGAPPVTVQAHRNDDGTATIGIADNGPGIPQADRSRVFGRFAKSDHARTRGTGSGLGLAIAQQHATILGARLTLTCPPQGGTIFYLSDIPDHRPDPA